MAAWTFKNEGFVTVNVGTTKKADNREVDVFHAFELRMAMLQQYLSEHESDDKRKLVDLSIPNRQWAADVLKVDTSKWSEYMISSFASFIDAELVALKKAEAGSLTPS